MATQRLGRLSVAVLTVAASLLAIDGSSAQEKALKPEMQAPEKRTPTIKDFPKAPDLTRPKPEKILGGNPLDTDSAKNKPKLPGSYGGNVDFERPGTAEPRPSTAGKTHDTKKPDSAPKGAKAKFHRTEDSDLTGEKSTTIKGPNAAEDMEKKAGIKDPTKAHGKNKSDLMGTTKDFTKPETKELGHNNMTSARDPVPQEATSEKEETSLDKFKKLHLKDASVTGELPTEAEWQKIIEKAKIDKAVADFNAGSACKSDACKEDEKKQKKPGQ